MQIRYFFVLSFAIILSCHNSAALALSENPASNSSRAGSRLTPSELKTSDQDFEQVLKGTPGRLPLPAENALQHEKNAVLDPLALPVPIQAELNQERLIKLEASFDESISLKEALLETLRHNLPIRISRESWNYQKCQLLANLFEFLPSFNLGYNLTQSRIWPGTISANARVFSTQVTYPVFQGGSVLYNSIAQGYRNAGWRHAYESTINDALLDVYNKYLELLLQNALLRIKAHALSLSRLLVDLNTGMYESGVATQFDVMQARTQHMLDKEAWVEQQLACRQAALDLSYQLDMPVSVNLITRESKLQEYRLLPEQTQMSVNQYARAALLNRPELRQYEMFRLAAARTVQASASSLYPSVSFFTSYADTDVSSNESSDSSDSSTLENAGVFTGTTRNLQLGFNITWTLSNLGLLNTANLISARALSRQAMLQANQELLTVMQEVRSSYDRSIVATKRIDDAASAVFAARGAHKLANLRLKTGLGNNLEIIQAQKFYINALIKQAQAIVESNKAQAALLHASGLISVDRLIAGYSGEKNNPKKSRALFRFW